MMVVLSMSRYFVHYKSCIFSGTFFIYVYTGTSLGNVINVCNKPKVGTAEMFVFVDL